MPTLPPKIDKAGLSPNMKVLVDRAKALYKDKLSAFVVKDHSPPAYITAAPGRVNLIGEHTDYTGGFVLPFAIDKYTVAYGTGYVHTNKGSIPTSVKLRCVSDQAEAVEAEERKIAGTPVPPTEDDPKTWVTYVLGVIAQFLPDLPHEGCVVDLAIAFASDVPVGKGLSSSAALEVATAMFMECFVHDEFAYGGSEDQDMPRCVQRALRCQKAENEWAYSPCGIMDQLVSSCAEEGKFMLIDCRSLEITQTDMKVDKIEQPVLLITDSGVSHSIADSRYGQRRGECHDALEAMQQVPLYHVLSLRDATLQDVETAKPNMEEDTFKRAKHVVTENTRTKECKTALKLGVWDRVGELMSASHKSLAEDFEVSCDEVNLLVNTAQECEGVYGSRITGGGFGGCVITLVKKESVGTLIEKLNSMFMEVLGRPCESFIVSPAAGAKVLAIDMDCKP